MYESCLLVLYTCRHDDTNHIQMLWKSIVCEEVLPCSTRSEQAYRFLQSLPENSMYTTTNSDITLLSETATAEDSKPLFESGLWMQKLEGRIVSLGKEVYGKGADYVFPVDFVASCLEGKRHIDFFLVVVLFGFLASNQRSFLFYVNSPGLQRTFASSVSEDAGRDSQGWPFRILVSVGVPYLVSLDAYERIIGKEDHTLMGGVDQGRRLEHLMNIVVMLEAWVKDAQSALFGTRNAALDQMSNALASGSILSRIESFKAQLQSLPGATSSVESRLRTVEDAIKHL
jgi:nuclear pore complex protein Nup155